MTVVGFGAIIGLSGLNRMLDMQGFAPWRMAGAVEVWEVFVTYKLTYTEMPGYLHAIVTGVNSLENVAQYLEDVLQECQARHIRRVLIEEQLEGPRLRTMDVFQIAAEGSTRAQGYFEAVAYVDVNAQGDLMKFAETIAVNRYLPVSVFRSVRDAEVWLQEKAGQVDGQESVPGKHNTRR